MPNSKKAGIVLLIPLLSVLLLSSFAWACTRQSTILALTPRAGMPGESIKLQGVAEPGSPVIIHWNSARGPVVGQVTAEANGNFFATATVPSVKPDVYFVISKDGAGRVARHALEVTGVPAPATQGLPASGPAAASLSVAPDLWSGFESSEARLATPTADPPRPAGAGGMSFALGMSLLTLGVTALTAGLTASILSRRTAPLRSRR